jgi:glycosyltransferase involved in cell wall biosynthesis
VPPAEPVVRTAGTTIDLLVVASWYPAYDDAAAGRFVADQVEALAATGTVRPAIISFDGARLSGGAAARSHQEAVVSHMAATAVKAGPTPFVVPAGPAPAAPVARLTIPDGRTPVTGATHALTHRVAALADLATIASATGEPARGVVHAHTAYPDGAAAAELAGQLGWPLVVTEHSSFVDRVVADPAIRAAYESTLGRAHRVVAVSEMLAAELRSAFPTHAERIIVIPNAVPVAMFGGNGAGTAGERVADELLFVGYRKPSKGIGTLLRGVAVARASRPTIRLRLLGRSPEPAVEAEWRRLAAELGLADATSFEEPADRAGIAEAMARASLFVHASPRETFGVVAVEALASGLPTVATDSGGVTEILGPEPERFGAIVPVDDPEALGSAIVGALERLEQFDPIEMRASVEQRFGAAYVAERLLVLYREALAIRTEPGRSFHVGNHRDGPRSEPRPGRTIVVALDRERAAARLAAIPAGLRSSLVVVSASEPRNVPLPPLTRLIEVAVDHRWRQDMAMPAAARRPGLRGRLARLAIDPRGTTLRVLGRDPGSARALAPASAAVEALARELATDGPSDIVALDGHDFVAAEQAVRSGVARMAGGLRHLADRWRESPTGSDVT